MSAQINAIDRSRSFYFWNPTDRREVAGDNQYGYLTTPTSSISPAARFARLVREWKHDTSHLSLISQRISHPAYRQILRMDPEIVVPLILDEMEREPGHWFHALMLLTGENPVPRTFRGTVSEAAEYWIRWGRQNIASQRTQRAIP